MTCETIQVRLIDRAQIFPRLGRFPRFVPNRAARSVENVAPTWTAAIQLIHSVMAWLRAWSGRLAAEDSLEDRRLDSLEYIPNEAQPAEEDGSSRVGRPIKRNGLAGAALAEATASSGEWWILLVEDEAFVRRVTAEVLSSVGYHLLLAASANEALEVCHANGGRVNLLLTDLVLPGNSGRELARDCRALYPGMRVLFISGYAEQQALCQISGESHEYLAKPFSTDALLNKVREILSGASSDLKKGLA